MTGLENLSVSTSASWKKKNKAIKFLIGAVALFIFLASINFLNSGIRNYFFTISAPIQKTFWSFGASISGGAGTFLNAGSYAKENQNLKSENQRLLSQIFSLQLNANALQAQSEVLLASQGDNLELKMAGVAGLNSQDELSIDKGSADGIMPGMPVINSQKALAGTVSKVYKNFSEVTLISNKNSVVNVKVLDTEIEGVVRGAGGLDIYLDLIPIDDILNEGDTLVTSALEGNFPKGLLAGKITKVEKNDQDPHQKAQVQPFFSTNTDSVFIITNYKR